MRRLALVARLSPALLAALVLQGAGCFDSADDCALNPILQCGPWAPDAGPAAGCDPSTSSGPVADSCGVFVSVSGDDGHAGTKAQPVKTIGAALGKGAAIYACAGAMPFSEAVTVGKAVRLFGALDCASWGYDATKKTQLTAAADAVPLTLGSTAAGSEVHDFAITAADASKAGGSSIAVVDQGASLVLEGVSVTAGAGAAGAAGVVQAQVVTPAMANGSAGTDDAMCNVMSSIGGGNGGQNTCGNTDTSGGGGGTGFAAMTGGNGGDGSPMTPANGGAGQAAASCNPGTKGSDGSTGTTGTGARGVGDISASGYLGPTGLLGVAGGPGQGGGGGGGAKQCAATFAGPSGGGGGAGGCAGGPGNPGQSGGSSIGILMLGATLTLNAVSIATHDGGAGGVGGDGQPGGNGGLAGHAIGGAACDGGKGGQGGAGGPGGGGAGGHSIAIAIKGGALPSLSTTTIVPGMGGAGGSGGNMDMTMQTKGDGGMACKTLDFTNPTSPTACAM